jgi:polar amino acid transport system substrate-binding protein
MRDTLRIGAAFPDPPFNSVKTGGGLDVSLMNAIADKLGMKAELIPYTGRDFNGIFDTLASGGYDCVTSGTTVTPGRERKASFCDPYLISGQSLAVNVNRQPHVHGIDDLGGLTIGVQHGNTSQPIAEDLVAHGRAKAVRVYDYGDIGTAISDLTTGGCDAFMKLAPVLTALVRPVADVEVVARGLSSERIAVAVRIGSDELRARINTAQAELERSGALAEIRTAWLGAGRLDQSGPERQNRRPGDA